MQKKTIQHSTLNSPVKKVMIPPDPGSAITSLYASSNGATLPSPGTKLKAILSTGLRDGGHGFPVATESIKTSMTLKGVVESILTLNSDGAWILRRMYHESFRVFLAIPRYTLKHQKQSEFQYLHANQAIHVQI